MKAFRIILPLAVFAIAAVAMLPLRVAWAMTPASSGLGARTVEGTVWNGRITGLVWSGIELGDFQTSASLFDVLPSPAVRLDRGAGYLKSAAVRPGNGALSISDLELRVPLSMLDARLPATSELHIADGEAELAGSECTRAAGKIRVDPAPQLGLPELAGALSCNAGELLATLATQAGARATVVVPLDGRTLPSVRDATPDLALALAASGIATTRDAAE